MNSEKELSGNDEMEMSGMENRERILSSALELFYERGYDAVGIQEICQQSGITKPTLYHYFGSKYGLLETLLDNCFSEFLNQVAEAAKFRDSVETSLNALATTIIDFANVHHREYMLLMSMNYSARENEVYRAVSPYVTRLYNQTVGLFEQAAPLLGNMNGRQKQFAIGFLGLINHYILFLGYHGEKDQMPEVSEETKHSLVHQFMHGIYS